MLNLKQSKQGVLLPLRVKPRARSSGIDGARDGVLLVSVQAAPADGAANAAVLQTVAEALGCAKSALALTRGHKSRDKTICIASLSAEEVRARLTRFI